MELTFNDLRKRDVINVKDGACLGRITDINLTFPSGKFLGVFVPGKRKPFILRPFGRKDVYIEESKIIKIGNDVILVNLGIAEECANVNIGEKPPPPKPPNCEMLFGQDSKTNSRIDMGDY